MGVFDLVGKAAKGAKKAAPFFSKADIVLDELPRGKGLGNEFLGELVKKGAKPTELRERGIEKALKDKPKMTKAEVQKVFESNPAPKVQEKVLSSESPDWDEFLEAKAQEEYGVDWFDLSKQEKARLEKMYEELPTTKYEQYRTPGGENYREILLKLPKRGLTKMEQDELMLYEADLRRTGGQATPERMARYQELKAKEPAGATNYTSGHYKEDPNLLAHIRVQDFKTQPSKGFAVVNTRSGFRSEVFPTIEQAQAALVQYPENLQKRLKVTEAQGRPKKVLLVDEIQSDWHQEGRKKGYQSPATKQLTGKIVEHKSEFGFQPEYEVQWSDGSFSGGYGSAEEAQKRLNAGKTDAITTGVPDAPFKKNWHELAMKRVLDYAAENGYDSIAITPGAEQVKRYDLSKQLDKVMYSPYGDGTFEVSATLPDGREFSRVAGRKTIEEIENTFGKEIAQKMAKGEKTGEDSGVSFLSGEGLQVGGEGMKGFYDKILPDYLNNFGKQYGASVREAPLNYTPSTKQVAQGAQDDALLGQLGVNTPTVAPTQYHMFDITPQLREEVKNKGLPMYGKVSMPALEGLAAGSGAATIGSQMFDENNEQQVQNPVHFTENPDAMLLELMQRN